MIPESKTFLNASDRPTMDEQNPEPVAVHTTIPERIAAFAATDPEQIAVKTQHDELSFADLDRVSNQIATVILRMGHCAGAPVALLTEVTAAQALGMLGILKAGGCYVSLQPSYPLQRLEYMLADSQAALIITDNCNMQLAVALAKEQGIINLDAIMPLPSFDLKPQTIDPSTYASINYSSGSTGLPKGIIHTHRSTISLGRAAGKSNVTRRDRVAVVGSSLAFNRTILNGASVYPWLVTQEGFTKLADWLRVNAITVFLSVPSVFRNFVATLPQHEQIPSLRKVILTGETLYRKDVAAFRRHLAPDCLIVNELGSNETKTYAQFLIDRATELSTDIVPVGQPLLGKSVKLLGDEGREVGIGEIGEIVVTTRNLPPGYWQRPELTQEKFRVADTPDGASSYLTGDLGYWLPGGVLVHYGRKDWQYKIRGQKVEPAEIEAALQHLDGVAEAVVVAHKNESGDNRLIAYFTSTQKPTLAIPDLRRKLADRLPSHMIPSEFVQLFILPRTPNGKIDRLALPEPDDSRRELGAGYVAPRDIVEQQLASIWRETLGIEKVGIHDDFFALGGHSLLAARATARITSVLQVDLQLSKLFESPTIEAMSREIKLIRNAGSIPQGKNGRQRDPMGTEHAGSSKTLGTKHVTPLYLETVRQAGNKVIVWLGQRPPFALLRGQSFAACAILWLKLDGLHIVPPRHDSIKALAQQYVDELTVACGARPIIVCGYCYSGLIAFEVVRQMSCKLPARMALVLVDAALSNKTAYNADSSNLWKRANGHMVAVKAMTMSDAGWYITKRILGRISQWYSRRRYEILRLLRCDSINLRWNYYSSHYSKLYRSHPVGHTDSDIYVVARALALRDHVDRCKSYTEGRVLGYAADTDDHHSFGRSFVWEQPVLNAIKEAMSDL